MKWTAVVLCVLVVLPLMAQCGNIGKDDDEKKDEQKEEKRLRGSEKFKVKGDPPKDIKDIFTIPENMTEDEWHDKQYEEFQKKEYNAFQKQQFRDYEKMRFQAWQMQKFQEAQHKKHQELTKENEKFVLQQQVNMKSEAEKHDKWLQALLANDKERQRLLKQIKYREAKAKRDL